MSTNTDDWMRELEAELSALASDMWATQKRLEEKGFRVDGGNKAPSGWWLTAINRNITNGNIRVQSDGTKIAIAVEQEYNTKRRRVSVLLPPHRSKTASH